MRKDRDFILRISKVLKESYNISVDIKFRWLGEGRCDIDDCDFCESGIQYAVSLNV